jgi:hypothetical protein
MKIRELLQKQIWSKEASRKILRPFGKFLKWAGIVSVALAAVIGIVVAVELSWLTGGERKAARDALVQIQALEKLEIGANGESVDVSWTLNYDAAEQLAKTAVSNATFRAWTVRDRQVAVMLSGYLWEIEDYRKADLFAKTLSESNELPPEENANVDKFKQREHSSQLLLFGLWRSKLHKQLD